MKTTQAQELAYLKSTGWTIYRQKNLPVVIAAKPYKTWKGEIRIESKAFRNERAKADWYFTFRDETAAQKYAAQYLANVAEAIARQENARQEKKTAREKLKAYDHWQVGDVAYTSWGYDQTNVEWYEVVTVKAKSVIVRQIKGASSDSPGSPFGGHTQPRRREYIGPEISCPLDTSGSFKAGPCYNGNKPSFRHHCSKWTGKRVYTSSYH